MLYDQSMVRVIDEIKIVSLHFHQLMRKLMKCLIFLLWSENSLIKILIAFRWGTDFSRSSSTIHIRYGTTV